MWAAFRKFLHVATGGCPNCPGTMRNMQPRQVSIFFNRHLGENYFRPQDCHGKQCDKCGWLSIHGVKHETLSGQEKDI